MGQTVDDPEPKSSPPPELEKTAQPDLLQPSETKHFAELLEEEEMSEGQLMTFCHDLGWDGNFDHELAVERRASKHKIARILSTALEQVSDDDLLEETEMKHTLSTT